MALLFAGCTDILDIEPNNKVVADKVLTTEEGLRCTWQIFTAVFLSRTSLMRLIKA
jgi:hypothetical protein